MTNSKTSRTIGWALTIFVVLFLVFDGAMKLVQPEEVTTAVLELGYPAGIAPTLGILLLAITALFLWPKTAWLGAVLLTGYLGGAVATHLRLGNPLFTHTLFPVYVGLIAWTGLLLRKGLGVIQTTRNPV